MTISLIHTFQSAKSDDADTTLIRPTNWNAEHTITMATAKVLGRSTAGAGAVEELSGAALKSIVGIASTSTIGRMARFTDTAGTTADTTGLYEDGSGNVGIGTTSPLGKFEVKDATPAIVFNATTTTALFGFEFRSNGTLEGYLKQQPNTSEFRLNAGRSAAWGGFFTIYTDTAERMRIDASGNVRIANTISVPASSPAGCGQLYVDSGALKYRGSSGTVTTLGAA